jgi:hypothetical protein
MNMSLDMNFIKVLNKRTQKPVGFAALVKGSEEERELVERFLDLGILFSRATESEFKKFDGDFIKVENNVVLCAYAPLVD